MPRPAWWFVCMLMAATFIACGSRSRDESTQARAGTAAGTESAAGRAPSSRGNSAPQRSSSAETRPLPSAAPASAEDWPLYLHDVIRSGAASDGSLKPPLAIGWEFKTGGPIVASPIVVGETVFVGSEDHRVYALKATEWGERWRFAANGEIHQAAAYADGILVVVDIKSNLYGLNAGTGELLWQRQLPGWTVSPPLFADGLVWLGIHPDQIVAIDPRSGQRAASYRNQTTIAGSEYVTLRGRLEPRAPATASLAERKDLPFLKGVPVRAAGYTYAAYQDGSIRAFDAEEKTVWEGRVPGAIDGTPAIARGWLYVPSTNGILYAFTSDTNAKRADTFRGESVTIVRREAETRSAARATAPVETVLNDGLELPLVQARDGWAQVRLPNGSETWLNPGDWAALSDAAGGAPFRENRPYATVEDAIVLPIGAEAPVWSPDGTMIAYFRRDDLSGRYWHAQSLWVYHMEEREARSRVNGAFFNPRLSWSLDGEWIAFETYDGDTPIIGMVSPSGPHLRRVTEGTAPAWSPVAHQLALFRTGLGEEQLWRVNSNGTGPVKITGLPIRGYVSEYEPLLPASWHPKGVYLAVGAGARYYSDGKARLLVTGVTEKALVSAIQTPAEKFRSIEWSPDGRKIAAVLAGHVGGSVTDPLDQRVYVYWYDGSKPPLSVPHTAATWVSANALAYVELSAVRGNPSRVWLLDVESQRRALLLEAHVKVTGLAWIPARERLFIWSTSDYLRDGKYQPAETRGWIVRIARDPTPS